MTRTIMYFSLLVFSIQAFKSSIKTIKCNRNPYSASADDKINREQYLNPLAQFLGLFVKQPTALNNDEKKWSIKKRKKTSLQGLAKDLEKSIKEKEWFVTGNVDPQFFSEDFQFEDPDVKILGIREYSEGVKKIFTEKSRAQVVKVQTDTKLNTITVTWRLEGAVNVGFGLKIKPFIVFTDYNVSSDGLIVSQLDRFSIPGYDILLSALFPPLSVFLSPPAPPID